MIMKSPSLVFLLLGFLIYMPKTQGSTFHNEGAFVHLFEWRWSDVALECEEWLSPLGYSAVQVSPPQEHILGSQWWTRYQPVSYNLTSRGGDEGEFRDMVERCVDVGVDIWVDGVINHQASGKGMGSGGSVYSNRNTPLFDPSSFHHLPSMPLKNCKVNDNQNQTNVQSCDLEGLPDLDSSQLYVQDQINTYLSGLFDIGVGGLRIDAAKHIKNDQLQSILKDLSSEMEVFQEVHAGEGEPIQPEDYFDMGRVTEFNYANDLTFNTINQDKMGYIIGIGEEWGLIDDAHSIIFIDNHDTQRDGSAPLTYKDDISSSHPLYEFSTILMLSLGYGMPKVMSSYYFDDFDQGPPSSNVHENDQETVNCGDGINYVCEHRWLNVAKMIEWKNLAATYDYENYLETSSNQISFSRGSNTFIAFNRDEHSSFTASLPSSMEEGTYCNIMGDFSQTFTQSYQDLEKEEDCEEEVSVDKDGFINASLSPFSVLAIHSNSKLS